LFSGSGSFTPSITLNPSSSTVRTDSRTVGSLVLQTTTWPTTPDTGRDCASQDILQSLCTADLPSLVKIANIWDVYSVLFSNDVINELMLNCATGEWCIRDEFDIFRAKMAEQADMVLNSAIFSGTCDEVSLGCLQSVVQRFQSCSFGEVSSYSL
jgi:hypothetical protein